MKQKIVNIMGLVGSIIVFLVLASSFVKSVRRIRDGDTQIKKTENRLNKIDEENKKLAEQLQITQSEEFMEKQLRDKLGLAREGEIILVLPEHEIVKKLAPTLPNEESVTLKPNWQKWVELFK